MTYQSQPKARALDVGVALLHPDGSVSIPAVGRVETSFEGLRCESGSFDVKPGFLVVRYDSGSCFGMVFENGKWTEHSDGDSTWDLAKWLARLASTLLSGFLFAVVLALWILFLLSRQS